MEDSNYVAYKVGYSKAEDDTVTVSLDSKEKVQGQYTYVSVNELKDLQDSKNAKLELEKSQNELKSANTKIEELDEQVKSLNEKLVEKSNNSKVDTDKFEELTNKLVSLNAMVAEMQPIVDKYNKDAFEKAFNQAKEDYKVTFTSINALDVFELDSTQELIKESINSVKEKADTAKFSLNALIVNSIKPVEEKVNEDEVVLGSANVSINQVTKADDTKELTDVEDDVLSEYGFNY
jgi:multidrug resistance efflux pump